MYQTDIPEKSFDLVFYARTLIFWTNQDPSINSSFEDILKFVELHKQRNLFFKDK